MGKTVKRPFNGTILQQIINKKQFSPGGCLSLDWGYIHVYDHYIQTSSRKRAHISISGERLQDHWFSGFYNGHRLTFA